MKDEKDVPHSSYSIDEILAEEEVKGRQKRLTQEKQPHPGAATADDIVRSAREALDMDAGIIPHADSGKPEGKKKKKHSFFGRKKRHDDFVPEDDIYYGLQLKSLEEYRHDYEETIRLDTTTLRKAEECARKRRAELLAQQKAAKQKEKEHESPEGKQEPEEAASETPANMERVKTSETEPTKETEKTCPKPSADAGSSKSTEAGSTKVPEKAVPKDSLEPLENAAGDTKAKQAANAPVEHPQDSFHGTNLNPYPPAAPPRPDLPPTEPPVPPAVQPGPQSQPEIGIPAEPPLGPAGIPAPGPLQPGIRDLASLEKPSVPKGKAEQTSGEISALQKTAKTPATGERQWSLEEKQAPVKEPVSPPSAKDEAPVPPAEKEPAKHPVPDYRVSSRPLHVIDLNCMEDTLAAEASGYEVAPVHAPEPIPFPAPDESKSKPEKPVTAESSQEGNLEAGKVPAAEKKPEDAGKVVKLPAAKCPPQQKKSKNRFRFFGSDEDISDTGEIPDEPEEELDDYNSPGDAPSIQNDLSSQVRRFLLRLIVTGICTAVMLLFSVLWEHPAVLPQELHSTPQTYLTVQLIFLITAAAFCGSTIGNGLHGLFTFQANTDSAVSIAVLAAALQDIVFLFLGIPGDCSIYSSLAVFALFLNTAGKLSMAKRIFKNFRFLTSQGQKYAVQTFDDFNTALHLTKGLNPGEPRIAYQTKAGFLCHFLCHSYSADDPSEHVSQSLAPIGFLASLILCIASAVLTKSPETALTAFTAAACVCIPFADLLSVNLPLARLSKLAAKCGGMVVGWDAVQRFGETNAILLDAQDLFPHGTVVLMGIQTFAGQRIDEAILDATALTQAVGGPLSDLFSQIVKSRRDILPHIERPVYEDGLGISGTVRDRTVLVGTGGLLKKHGIEPPSHDYEEKYLRSGKIPVYLAAGGILVAMFLVSYRSDRRRATELRRLEYNGISLLVRTRDPNITPDLIADCFGLSPHFISILPDHDGNIYKALRDNPPKRASAVIITKGRATSMMRILTACMRQHGNITIGVALQTAGVALGFALAAFFTVCNGFAQFTVTALLLFEIFWMFAVIFIPRIRRP